MLAELEDALLRELLAMVSPEMVAKALQNAGPRQSGSLSALEVGKILVAAAKKDFAAKGALLPPPRAAKKGALLPPPRASSAKKKTGGQLEDASRLGKSARLDKLVMEKVFEDRTEPISCAEVAKLIDLSPSTALRSITRLCDQAHIIVVGGGRSKKYRLPETEAEAPS